MRAHTRWTPALILGLLPLAATATDNCNPVGTWVVDVTHPPETFIPPISELISFLPGGAVLETSSDLPGVTGHGAWKRRPGCRIAFKVLKQVFDQANIQLLGFVRITANGKIAGNAYSSAPGDVNVEFVLGSDPDAPPATSTGGSTSLGKRVKAE